MMRAPLKLNTEATHIHEVSDIIPLGCHDVETVDGIIHFHDAHGFSTVTIERDDSATTVAILVYDTDAKVGLVVQADPDTAVQMAMSILKLADQIKPRTQN